MLKLLKKRAYIGFVYYNNSFLVLLLYVYMYLILPKLTKHFGTNQLFPLLKYMICIS